MLTPAFGCQNVLGSITPGGGASQVVAGDRFDHRFPILSSGPREDGSIVVAVGGDVTYRMPAHGIEESTGAFKIVLAADGLSGNVYGRGTYKPFSMGGDVCTDLPRAYDERLLLTLDLTGITPVTADGFKRWVHVPATVAADVDVLGGGEYRDGTAWGSFTFAVPVE